MIELSVEPLAGAAIAPYLDALARLRIEVFREFPYLYDGSLAYEQGYLRGFAASRDSLLVLARDGERVVGASTALPLVHHGDRDALTAPLRRVGIQPRDVYYFGESVLQTAYRGRGVGGAFFTHREARALALGYRIAAFCAVERPRDHPARPHDYQPHDAFWTRRGYRRRPDIVATFEWRDIGASVDSEKPMVFWTKELPA